MMARYGVTDEEDLPIFDDLSAYFDDLLTRHGSVSPEDLKAEVKEIIQMKPWPNMDLEVLDKIVSAVAEDLSTET